MNAPTISAVSPPRPDESSLTQSAVRPIPPAAVEVVDGFQQISPTQREQLLRQLDGHITPESEWLRAYNPPGSTAFERAQAREQRAQAVA